MLNSHVVRGKLHQVKGGVRKQMGTLTGDRQGQVWGGLEQLAGRIQERYGFGAEEALHTAHEVITTYGDDLLELVNSKTNFQIKRKKPRHTNRLLVAVLGFGLTLLTSWVMRKLNAAVIAESVAEETESEA